MHEETNDKHPQLFLQQKVCFNSYRNSSVLISKYNTKSSSFPVFRYLLCFLCVYKGLTRYRFSHRACTVVTLLSKDMP